MKNRDIIELYNNFEDVKHLSGIKLAYCIVKNKKIIEKIIKELNEIRTPAPEYTVIKKEKDSILLKYAVKDETGLPKIIKREANGRVTQYYDIQDEKAFKAEIEDVDFRYKEIAKAQEEKEALYQLELDKEQEIVLHMLEQENLPENITANELEKLLPIIKN